MTWWWIAGGVVSLLAALWLWSALRVAHESDIALGIHDDDPYQAWRGEDPGQAIMREARPWRHGR